MNRDEALLYCFDLAGQLEEKLNNVPEELLAAIQDCHPKYALWALELWELASELYLVLPKAEGDHMQQAYATRLEEHARFIENERGEEP